MKNTSPFLRTQQGMVLMSALTILTVLTLVGLGVGLMLQNDFRVVANLRRGTEAFYFSVAGLEWGKREVALATIFPPVPVNQSSSFSGGAFAVTFQPATVIGPLSAQVVVRSAGTSHGAQHSIQARLTKSYDLADAALALRGNGASIGLAAPDIYISGADHDAATGIPIAAAKPRSAVSTGDEGLRALVAEALGTRQGVLDGSAGAQALTTSGYFPTAFASQLANELCASVAAVAHAVPAGAGLIMENQAWGNPSAPQLHCIDGQSAAGDAVTLAGNFTGAGILVVRNADLILSGLFRWEGLILVTGNDVSLKTTGSGNKELLGAVVVNETGIPAANRKVLDMEGAIRLLFSRQALSRASQLIPIAALPAAYGALPAVISQDYWRAETL